MQSLDEVLKNLSKYRKYYDESKFWQKVESIVAKTGSKIVYNALLLFYTLKSPKVSLHTKTLIYSALGYLILPVDLIPDFLIPIGYTDDIAVMLYAIGLVKHEITPEIENNAREKLSDLDLYYVETNCPPI